MTEQTTVDFKVSEKAIVYAIAAEVQNRPNLSKEDCVALINKMFSQFGNSWDDHTSSMQRYNLRPAWDLAKQYFQIKAESIDRLK